MSNWREHVQEYLADYMAKNPPVIGGGRRSIIIPEPRPEDERPRYKTEGEVPEGYMRGEVIKPANADGRLGGFWAHVKHQDSSNHSLERVFTGDVVDILEKEFEVVFERNWVRQPWTKTKENVKKPQAA